MERRASEFRKAAIAHGIQYWPVRRCAICDEWIGYRFFETPKSEVVFDPSCGCCSYSRLEPSSWEKVAKEYNKQDSPTVIKEMDEFWHFGEPSKFETLRDEAATKYSNENYISYHSDDDDETFIYKTFQEGADWTYNLPMNDKLSPEEKLSLYMLVHKLVTETADPEDAGNMLAKLIGRTWQ